MEMHCTATKVSNKYLRSPVVPGVCFLASTNYSQKNPLKLPDSGTSNISVAGNPDYFAKK